METSDSRDGDFAYDVALSFAGEQRPYVEKVAAGLRRRGLRPFYDDYEKANLWGKNLYEHLDWVYQKAARYCVLFASEAYAKKVWTTHERRSAQARALHSSQEYVLPVRFDDTEIPGIPSTIVYVDARSLQPGRLAKLISEKLGPQDRKNFFPPVPNKLFAALNAVSSDERDAIDSIARSFMQTLTRMTEEERRLVAHVFLGGCPSELPENIHISLDKVRRDLGVTPTAIVESLRGMSSIGFRQEVRSDEDHGDDLLVVKWYDTTMHKDGFTLGFAAENSTEVAVQMIDVGSGDRCQQCAEDCIIRLDFSLLASSTSKA